MKPLDDILADGAQVVCRPLDRSIPFELSFVVEATIKTRHPDRDWPNSGLSPRQRGYRDETEAFVNEQHTVLATYVKAGQAPGTSVILGFATETTGGVVTMVYVKRKQRGYGIGRLLIGPGERACMKPNECWRRWIAYHAAKAA